MVRLLFPGGCLVPRRFPAHGSGWVGDHDAEYRWQADMHVGDDGIPSFLSFYLVADNTPLSLEQVAQAPAVVYDAAVQAAIRQYADREQVTLDQLGLDSPLHEQEEMSQADAVRRRRQITPDLLADVLACYETGGIAAVVDRFSYSERYAWKLLKRARTQAAS